MDEEDDEGILKLMDKTSYVKVIQNLTARAKRDMSFYGRGVPQCVRQSVGLSDGRWTDCQDPVRPSKSSEAVRPAKYIACEATRAFTEKPNPDRVTCYVFRGILSVMHKCSG